MSNSGPCNLAVFSCATRRLRNGVKQVLQECLSASQAASRQVDASLSSKLLAAGELRNELAQQLAHVQGKIKVAVEHRETLKESLQAKQRVFCRLTHAHRCWGC